MFHLKNLLVTSIVVGGLATAAVSTAVFHPFAQEMELPQPNDHHKMLLKSVGEWEGTLSFSTPGQEDTVAPASETVTAVGGFWVTGNFKCEFQGMPFEGHSIIGYDDRSEKMVGTWCDGYSSFLAVMEGTIDGNTVEMKWAQPVMGSKDLVPHRSVTVHDEDSYEMTFFQGEGDDEVQSMVIAMKRK